MSDDYRPIGIFDSGYGGLTIFREIQSRMPEHDFIYLGDNARAPYGTRSMKTVHHYTLQAVDLLFKKGCSLVILACNTASAMALRNIQQKNLSAYTDSHRVLGVLRPTTEIIGSLTKTGHIGICATEGTVSSDSYVIEAKKFAPQVKVFQQACPLWVPLIENDEVNSKAADDIVKRDVEELLSHSESIDSILLACTHYPMLMEKIKAHVPQHIRVITQGEIVSGSLLAYLQRHKKMDESCSKNGTTEFLTTGDSKKFDEIGSRFFGAEVVSRNIDMLS